MLSPNKRYLVVNCFRHIHIYDLIEDISKKIETPEGVILSGFDPDSEKFLFSSKQNEYTEYYIKREVTNKIILPPYEYIFNLREPVYYTKDGNLIGLASSDTTYYKEKIDVMMYDFKNRQYFLLTNDGLKKYDLMYYPKKEN